MDESDIAGTKLLKAQVIFRKVSKKISNDRQGLWINVRGTAKHAGERQNHMSIKERMIRAEAPGDVSPKKYNKKTHD